MEWILNLVYAAVGVAGLYYGAEFLVKGGVDLARKAGVSQLVIGLTLVAFATSAPELVVSASAALDGNPNISLGNVVGSNICNILLILGLSAVIAPLTVHRQLLKLDAPVMVISSILLAVFYFTNGGVNRIQALLFLAGLIVYTCYLIHSSRKENAAKAEESSAAADAPAEEKKLLPVWLAALLVILGIAFLVIGAKVFLISAVFAARKLQVSDAVIGLTVVAVGTSLPELATSVVAAFKGEQDIAIGNVIGSNIFNVLCILGIAPLISPLCGAELQPVDLITMLVASLLLIPMMLTRSVLSRLEGGILLSIYVVYIGYLVVQNS